MPVEKQQSQEQAGQPATKASKEPEDIPAKREIVPAKREMLQEHIGCVGSMMSQQYGRSPDQNSAWIHRHTKNCSYIARSLPFLSHMCAQEHYVELVLYRLLFTFFSFAYPKSGRSSGACCFAQAEVGFRLLRI